MDGVSSQSLEALTAHLVALDHAGVPLGLGPASRWRRAADELARLVAAGQGAVEALDHPVFAATPRYRRLVRLWASGEPLPAAIEALHRDADDAERDGRRLGWGFAYPALVAAGACVGVAVMSRTVLPLIESAYADLREPVGAGVAILRTLRGLTPAWLLGVPILLGFALWKLRWMRSSQASDPASAPEKMRLAIVGRDIAALLEAGVSHAEAARLSGIAPDEAPPLLGWALERRAAPAALRAIGSTYGEQHRRRSDAYVAWLPIVALGVIGGGAVLLYMLSLFVPVVELLWTLSEA